VRRVAASVRRHPVGALRQAQLAQERLIVPVVCLARDLAIREASHVHVVDTNGLPVGGISPTGEASGPVCVPVARAWSTQVSASWMVPRTSCLMSGNERVLERGRVVVVAPRDVRESGEHHEVRGAQPLALDDGRVVCTGVEIGLRARAL
jgi:hypothetical protein